jgi:GNAT superfamily N-acetyltransferase
MEIKTCSAEDINDLLFIAKTSYQDHYTYLWDDEGENYIKANFNSNQLQQELANPNAQFYLLYHHEKLVGFLKLNLNSEVNNYSSIEALELERIYFVKEATRKGLGKMVLEFVMDLAKKSNKTIVWLKAMNSSQSVKFYKKNQFEVIDEMILPYEFMKDEFRKIVTMIREI